MILSSYGCKVSWGPAGPAPPLSVRDISPAIGGIHPPRGNGECGTCECLRAACSWYPKCKSASDSGDFQKCFFNHHRPLSERSPLHSPRPSTLNSADFIVGTGDARGTGCGRWFCNNEDLRLLLRTYVRQDVTCPIRPVRTYAANYHKSCLYQVLPQPQFP